MARFTGKNHRLYYGAGPTQVEQLVSVSGQTSEADDIEYTEAGQTFKQFMAGLADGGTIEATVNYDSNLTTHAFLSSNIGVEMAFILEVPSGVAHKAVNFTFNGYVKSDALQQLGGANALQVVYTIKVTGAVTKTAATVDQVAFTQYPG